MNIYYPGMEFELPDNERFFHPPKKLLKQPTRFEKETLKKSLRSHYQEGKGDAGN